MGNGADLKFWFPVSNCPVASFPICTCSSKDGRRASALQLCILAAGLIWSFLAGCAYRSIFCSLARQGLLTGAPSTDTPSEEITSRLHLPIFCFRDSRQYPIMQDGKQLAALPRTWDALQNVLNMKVRLTQPCH
jgi:hypothetical protein